MATYVYDDTTMTTVIEAYKTITDLTSSTSEATQSALQVISSIASAGGDLGAEVGGTVLGNLRKANSSVSDALSKVKKVYSTFETARGILNKTSSYVSGNGVADAINKLAGMGREEQEEFVIDTSEFIGKTFSQFSSEPTTKTALSNAGDIAEAAVNGLDFLDSLNDQFSERFSSQTADIGATISYTVGSTLTAGTLVASDVVANAFSLDIPDHWIRSATYTVGDFSESVYRFVADGLESAWNGAKGLFT